MEKCIVLPSDTSSIKGLENIYLLNKLLEGDNQYATLSRFTFNLHSVSFIAFYKLKNEDELYEHKSSKHIYINWKSILPPDIFNPFENNKIPILKIRCQGVVNVEFLRYGHCRAKFENIIINSIGHSLYTLELKDYACITCHSIHVRLDVIDINQEIVKPIGWGGIKKPVRAK